MTANVENAIEQLRNGAPCSAVRTKEDGEGGAFVLLEDVEIGEQFSPSRSWIGFHLTFPYPDADVYPHFIDAAVRYVGSGETPNQHPNGDLPLALTRGDYVVPGFELAAIHISRRSNNRNTETDNALQKLLRIIDFLRTR
jgi:hypothetical protein